MANSDSTKRDPIAGAGKRSAPSKKHVERVKRELQELGVTPLGMMRFEAKYLSRVIHKGEHLKGVVYGRSKAGSVMLVATDRRAIYLDKKPFFVGEDEITYDIVSGVSFGRSLFAADIKLHTRIGDYEIRTFNQKCAENFVEYIEARCLETQGAGGEFAQPPGS